MLKIADFLLLYKIQRKKNIKRETKKRLYYKQTKSVLIIVQIIEMINNYKKIFSITKKSYKF